MVGSHVEVVVHDLMKPAASVIYIANGHVTGRELGASLLDGPANDTAFLAAKGELTAVSDSSHSVVVDYPTLSPTGKPLRSATVVFRDAAGEPFLALCLNADLSVAMEAKRWLEGFLPGGRRQTAPPTNEGPPSADEPTDSPPALEDLAHTIIDEVVRRRGKPVSEMTRDEKLDALTLMVGRGVLMVRGGVERVAGALGVSRFTVYNYLEVLREREGLDVPTGRRTR